MIKKEQQSARKSDSIKKDEYDDFNITKFTPTRADEKIEPIDGFGELKENYGDMSLDYEDHFNVIPDHRKKRRSMYGED